MSLPPEYMDDPAAIPAGFERRESCPLCDAPASSAAVHIDFPDIPVFKCATCGFIFPAWTMNTEMMTRYYREDFASDWHRHGQRLNSHINHAALARLVDLRTTRTFLDVGTGYGYLLQRLRDRHAIECTGIEPSTREAQWGRDHLHVQIITGHLDDNAHATPAVAAALGNRGFDLVACFEVIEHVPDPRRFVQQLADRCAPGGMVVINTDNFESSAVQRLGPRFPKWIPHSHISDFGPDTLRRCVQSVPELRIERELSYTAWEMVARCMLASLQKPRSPRQCYRFTTERDREMHRVYRFWPLRLAMARVWFTLTARRNLHGSMMYLAARKT